MPRRARLFEAVEAVASALSDFGRPYMIIGGIAVIARGVPRQTVDVDATVWGGDGIDLDALLKTLGRKSIIPRIDDVLEFARKRNVLLLRHDPSRAPIEITIGLLPFELEAMQRAREVSLR